MPLQKRVTNQQKNNKIYQRAFSSLNITSNILILHLSDRNEAEHKINYGFTVCEIRFGHLLLPLAAFISKDYVVFAQVIESSGFGADKFTMVRNNDGTGSLKVTVDLNIFLPLQSMSP